MPDLEAEAAEPQPGPLCEQRRAAARAPGEPLPRSPGQRALSGQVDRPLALGSAGQAEGPHRQDPAVTLLLRSLGSGAGAPPRVRRRAAGWPYQADAAQTRVQHGWEGLVVVEDPASVGAACGEACSERHSGREQRGGRGPRSCQGKGQCFPGERQASCSWRSCPRGWGRDSTQVRQRGHMGSPSPAPGSGGLPPLPLTQCTGQRLRRHLVPLPQPCPPAESKPHLPEHSSAPPPSPEAPCT